jgi:hypothetical protein
MTTMVSDSVLARGGGGESFVGSQLDCQIVNLVQPSNLNSLG